MHFRDLLTVGFVSVWAGTMQSRREFDQYLCLQFAADYGMAIDFNAKIEAKTEGSNLEIARLIAGFSKAKTFESECIEAASDRGLNEASNMLIIYDFKYELALIKNPNPLLKLIGVFRYPGLY